jgi:hypothetical protein
LIQPQPDLFSIDPTPLRPSVVSFLTARLGAAGRPSARELLREIERQIGLNARWAFKDAVDDCSRETAIRAVDRAYFGSMIQDGSVDLALRGEGAPSEETVSTIDALLRQSAVYRSSKAFREMIEFMGRFRAYSPYNNMLVRLQNPACGFYATERVWREKHHRTLIEDARPMLILAPRHPVLLVYDLDQTTGPPLPAKLLEFARFEGEWQPKWLANLLENAQRHRIRVEFKDLSSTFGGFATLHLGTGEWKARIVVHTKLDDQSRFGVLAHEMAHVLLGHLGNDDDNWWPSRLNLGKSVVEIEAESVAHIVTDRFGLKGASAAHLSGYVTDEAVPSAISLDHIAKTAGRIEQMSETILIAPKSKPPRDTKARRGPGA